MIKAATSNDEISPFLFCLLSPAQAQGLTVAWPVK